MLCVVTQTFAGAAPHQHGASKALASENDARARRRCTVAFTTTVVGNEHLATAHDNVLVIVMLAAS